jgi:hypothetical protein
MSTPAVNEVTRETVTFEHFERTWHVPAKQHFSHVVRYREGYNLYGNLDVAMCHAYLPPEEFVALMETDPELDDLDAFTDAMAEAMGLKSAGN